MYPTIRHTAVIYHSLLSRNSKVNFSLFLSLLCAPSKNVRGSQSTNPITSCMYIPIRASQYNKHSQNYVLPSSHTIRNKKPMPNPSQHVHRIQRVLRTAWTREKFENLLPHTQVTFFVKYTLLIYTPARCSLLSTWLLHTGEESERLARRRRDADCWVTRGEVAQSTGRLINLRWGASALCVRPLSVSALSFARHRARALSFTNTCTVFRRRECLACDANF